MKPVYKDDADLHRALRTLSDAFASLEGPNGQYWLGCSECSAVGLVPGCTVSVVCDDCLQVCECGLRTFEHGKPPMCAPST